MSILGTMPTYVVQASPLTKLFMPEWHDILEGDPALIFDEKPFEVRIPRAFGGLTFTHNKPVHVNKVVPVYPGRRLNNENVIDDLEGLIFWLTGGPDGMRSNETDIYGVVHLDLDMDVSGALSDIAMFDEKDKEAKKAAFKSYEEIQRELIKNTQSAIKKARELADQRVKRAMKFTHQNLLKQYETLKQDGKGIYAPSTAEAVGAFVLKSELDKASENRRKMFDSFTQNMQETFTTR